MNLRIDEIDNGLIAQLRNGNKAAFKILFEKYGTRLYQFSLKYLRDKEGAYGDEDFVAPERGGSAKVGEEFLIARKVYELTKNKPKEICNTMQPLLPGFDGGSTWGYKKAIDGHNLKVEVAKKMLK